MNLDKIDETLASLDRAEKALEEAVQENEWTLASTQMPPLGEYVLTVARGNIVPQVAVLTQKGFYLLLVRTMLNTPTKDLLWKKINFPTEEDWGKYDFEDGRGPVPAHRHPNGGGWVAESAYVAKTAYVGPKARVYGNARVRGYARVYGKAEVYGEAQVYGNACVYDNAWVYGKAQVYGNAKVYGNAWVYGNAKIEAEEPPLSCFFDDEAAFRGLS